MSVCVYCVYVYVCVIVHADIFTYLSNVSQKFRSKCEMVSYFLKNISQNGPKTPKNDQTRGRPNVSLRLVTTTVISRHSYKISRECYSRH